MVGTPATGLVRIEWHMSQGGLVIPTNWGMSGFTYVLPTYSPLQFLVADARNIIAEKAIKDGFEWLLFIDHDVILPMTTLVKFNHYMISGDVPLVGGVYFTKSVPSEPLLYRGRGNGYFDKWKFDRKVWVDGMGLGCHLIHVSLLKILYDEAPSYTVENGVVTRKIFTSPFGVVVEQDHSISKMGGTEDLPFYQDLIEKDVFARAGWKKYRKKKFPFLCDTSIFCRHIDENGKMFPSQGEENQYR